MKFANFFASWAVPEKFKRSLPAIFVLSTVSAFNWRRWFVSWLTVIPAFPDLTAGVKIITLQSGTCSLTNFFKSRNWSEISLEVNFLASFAPAWIIKWLGFFLIIGMRLCCIFFTFAPGKFLTITTCVFYVTSPKTPFIIESPVIAIVFLGYKSWLLLLLSSFEELFLEA